MILQITDASGQKKFFAGFYRDNSLCWSTAENLRPDARRQRILEGIEHVNAQYAELAVITKKLNAWLDSIDIDHADKKQVDRFRNLTDDCQYNADLLTEQILIASQKVRHIKDYISKQLIQNI